MACRHVLIFTKKFEKVDGVVRVDWLVFVLMLKERELLVDATVRMSMHTVTFVLLI